jgi:hypothetical protein
MYEDDFNDSSFDLPIQLRDLFFEEHNVNGIQLKNNIRLFIPSQYDKQSAYIERKMMEQDYDATSGRTLVVLVGQHHDHTMPLEICSWKRLSLLQGMDKTVESSPSTSAKNTNEYTVYLSLIAGHIQHMEGDDISEEGCSRRCDDLLPELQSELGDVNYYKYSVTGPAIFVAEAADLAPTDISSCYWLNS